MHHHKDITTKTTLESSEDENDNREGEGEEVGEKPSENNNDRRMIKRGATNAFGGPRFTQLNSTQEENRKYPAIPDEPPQKQQEYSIAAPPIPDEEPVNPNAIPAIPDEVQHEKKSTTKKSSEKKSTTKAASTEKKSTTKAASAEKKSTTKAASTEKKETTKAASTEKKETTKAASAEKKSTTKVEKKETTKAAQAEKKSTTKVEKKETTKTAPVSKSIIPDVKQNDKKETSKAAPAIPDEKSAENKVPESTDESHSVVQSHIPWGRGNQGNDDRAIPDNKSGKGNQKRRHHVRVTKTQTVNEDVPDMTQRGGKM